MIELNMRKTMDIEQVEREEAEKVADGTEYSWMDLTDWQSCHDLLHHLQYQTRADENECRRQFHEYFNVTSTAIIDVPKGCCFNVSVENVSEGATAAGTPTAINVQNANLVISRIA